ncbi:FUSC family protein [Gluconobacter oxydans]|uniref:FUSC family protein n=1 Tax=Gluconobacter oxydans TaxID=442 RepID=UPI000AAA91E8|nr:FUSC family protein [Gluconobacter oxydans]MCP1247725.1 FUSC family protein [Gluconobacter oxydans]WKE48799.1 FUSC family protein [Gluconobacter oxydans]
MPGLSGRTAGLAGLGSTFGSELRDVLIQRWGWLFAPSAKDLGFAVRTSVAAILSLLIAMWMELDSPQWAPLTVWVVATASRGESLSKARWRFAGTIIGGCMGVALIAAFPQQAGLFFIALALWIGLCCGWATFLDGYRRYGFLVISFTSAIVATGAISQPDDVFNVAMARGTYIMLGTVCEAGLAVLFLPNVQKEARARLLGKLQQVTAKVASHADVLRAGRFDPETEGRLLAELVDANTRIEFDVLEMGSGTRRSADHARAVLARLLAVLARAQGGATGIDVDRDLEAARNHIQAIIAPPRHDRFTFRTRSPRHILEAVLNGLRAATGIMGAWLLWEVTAWPSGPAFVSFVALVYGLLATREIPALASSGFYRGAVWCAGVAGIYAFFVVPAVTAPEYLALLLLIPMVIGGLAARAPKLVNHAFSFNMFLPVLIGPSNLMRYDEVSFLNGASAFLGAVIFTRVTFGVVFPFRADSHLRRTSAWVEQQLRFIARGGGQTVHQWLAINAASMVRAVRSCQRVPRDVMLAYMARHLNAMALGLWVIELRDAAARETTPVSIRRRLQVFLRAWFRKGDGAAPLAQTVFLSLRKEPAVEPDVRTALQRLAGDVPPSA